jgi:polyisoprenoid-binding protein YceI
MTIFRLIVLLTCVVFNVQAQKYVVEKSEVAFFSHAPLEDIKANNTTAAGIFDSSTGNIAFGIQIRDFQFEKALMKEHFNEKYMETDKYSKSTFQGTITGYDANVKVQDVTAQGKLTIHGVTRQVEIPGTIEKQGDKIIMKSVFVIKVADYKITIPKLLWQNIAEEIEVTVNFTFKQK